MEDTTPRIRQTTSPDGVRALLLGQWTAARLAEPADWTRINGQLVSFSATSEWDLREVLRLDHTGAQLLWNSWGQQWPQTLVTLQEV